MCHYTISYILYFNRKNTIYGSTPMIAVKDQGRTVKFDILNWLNCAVFRSINNLYI